jgi:hypothetical protein
MRTTSILRGVMSGLLLGGLAVAAPTSNKPTNRACWTSDVDMNTEYDASVPITGVTKTVRAPGSAKIP